MVAEEASGRFVGGFDLFVEQISVDLPDDFSDKNPYTSFRKLCGVLKDLLKSLISLQRRLKGLHKPFESL